MKDHHRIAHLWTQTPGELVYRCRACGALFYVAHRARDPGMYGVP